jgi:hypothetical protein
MPADAAATDCESLLPCCGGGSCRCWLRWLLLPCRKLVCFLPPSARAGFDNDQQ